MIMTKLKAFIALLRVKNWLKNVFILFPLIFSLNLLNIHLVIKAIVAFLIFCIASSIVYIVNDITDLEKDRLHPRKKNRPLPSGTISSKSAIITLIVCIISLFILLPNQNPEFIIYSVLYVLVNILYSFGLKKINLLESFIISSNFLIRVLAGCAAIVVMPSEWIIVVTFSVSIFLVFVKRKSEIKMLGDKATEHRSVLKYYSVSLLDKFIFISATITLTSYLLYTLNEEVENFFGTNRLFYTTIFVLLGIFRFIQLSESAEYDDEGDPTSLILKDRFIQIVVLAWLICTIAILYIK